MPKPDPVAIAGYAGVVVTVLDKAGGWLRGWHAERSQLEEVPTLEETLKQHETEDRQAFKEIGEALRRIERGQAVLDTKVDTLQREVNRLRDGR